MAAQKSSFHGKSKECWKKDKRKSIKNAIFEFYCQLYNKTDNEEKSVIWEKLKIAVEGVIWCSQIISLLWLPDMSITNWNKNMIIWEIIGYLKFDNVCSELGIMNGCLILSIAFISANFLSIIIFTAMIYNSFRLPTSVLSIFRCFFSFWKTFFLLPSIQIFTIFLKYNIFSIDRVAEYKNNNDLANFETSKPWLIGIVFSMIFTLILILLYTQFSGEIRHSLHKSTIYAKAHSKIDTHIATFTYFMPILYTILAQNYIIYLQILVIIFSTALIKETLILWPYFSFYSNSTTILRLFWTGLISFIFIFGRLIDNSLSISLLVIILGPLLSIFIIQFLFKLERKITKKIPNDIQNINSEYDLEKSLRYASCSNDIENKDLIIHLFENFFIDKKLYGTKLQVIWEANYCLFTLEDNSLAKVKLTKSKQISDLNLEANYQEYLCSKRAYSNYTSDYSIFLNFFVEFQRIKKKDKKLCINLLNFLNEVTAPKPNLRNLKIKLNSIDEDISALNEDYKQLTTKYANSKEALSLYASYSKDIAYDLEKSAIIELKIKSFDRIFSNSINDFSCFNENNGILIISNESQNFGEILYANNKSAEIFKIPLKNFINDNFFNFVHPYYKNRIINEAKRFIWFSSSLEIDLTQGFFLNLPKNLLECVGKISVTSINNFAISILIFREKEAKHQVALISDDLEIICHSKNFQTKNHANLVGSNIKKLFFNSENFDLMPFVGYRLTYFYNENFLVLSYDEFYGVKISYITLLKDSEEIKKFNSKEFIINNNAEHLQVGCSLLSVKLSESLASYRNTSLFQEESQSEENIDSKMYLFEAHESNDFSEKNDHGISQFSVNLPQNKFLKMVQISSKAINVLRLSFIFSVLSILAASIAVLVYAFATVNEMSDVEFPLYLGRTGKNFQKLSLLPQMILWAYFSQLIETIVLVPEINDKYIGTLADFEFVYSNVTLKSKNWNYCSGQSIINDANIDLWHIDNGIYTKKANLITTISQFIKYSYDFERKLNDSSLESPYEPFRFLLLNGYGSALNYCYNSLNDVIDCQKSKMSEFKTKMAILSAIGPIVIALCLFFISPCFFAIFKIEHGLWSKVRKNAYGRFFELKQKILDRLRYVHSEENISFFNQKPSKKPCLFISLWRWMWRAFIYFAIVSLFCLINVFYLYDKCAEYLSNRPEAIKNLIQAQILYTNLGIWAIQSSANTYGLPLCYQFPNLCPFSQADIKIDEVLQKIHIKSKTLRNSKYSNILSKKFKNLLYEKNQEASKDFFEFGTYSAQNYLLLDVYIIAFTACLPIDILIFTWNSLYIADFYDSAVADIDNYSMSMINNQMNIIVLSLGCFIFCLFVAAFGFYLPFFRYEKQYLQKINSILKMIPKN